MNFRMQCRRQSTMIEHMIEAVVSPMKSQNNVRPALSIVSTAYWPRSATVSSATGRGASRAEIRHTQLRITGSLKFIWVRTGNPEHPAMQPQLTLRLTTGKRHKVRNNPSQGKTKRYMSRYWPGRCVVATRGAPGYLPWRMLPKTEISVCRTCPARSCDNSLLSVRLR